MSDKATQKGLRDQLGDGYLNLLDSVRHSFEQAAWGQETTGDLANDFYRWINPPEVAPQSMGNAERGQGGEVTPLDSGPSNPGGKGDGGWSDLEEAIGRSISAEDSRETRRERENNAAEKKDMELEAARADQEMIAGAALEAGASQGPEMER